MGTKLGNLHILGASVEEVAPLLPGVIVGQWSERFVSAYSEEYQLGSAEQAGKRLSRKLPGATVLSAAIFDSDMVSFEVYQAGKRLTAHLLNPYEDINKLGDPKVFCEALELPAEDEKRLKVLWKKGNAEEQLELTAALLGAPLNFDPEFLPKEPVGRDVGKVDAWIAERPDPPKIKNVTKVELIQEENELCPMGTLDSPYFFAADTTEYGYSLTDGWLYRYTPEGAVVQEARVCPGVGNYPQEMVAETVCYTLGPDRVLWGNLLMAPDKDGGGGWSQSGVRIVWDSAGLLSLPLDIDGFLHHIWVTKDGGIGTITTQWTDWRGPSINMLSRYAKDGTCLYQKGLPEGYPKNWAWLDNGFYAIGSKGEMLFLDWEGNQLFCLENSIPPYSRYCGTVGEDILLLCREDKKYYLTCGDYFISRWDRKGNELARSLVLSGDFYSMLGEVKDAGDGKHILASSYRNGLYLLDCMTLEIVWQQTRKEFISWCRADGKDRRWLKVESSTLEGYDPAGNLVSRHRLKGEIINTRLDRLSRLMAYTYDRKNNIFRVYRIS